MFSRPNPDQAWHSLAQEAIAGELRTDLNRGLSEAEAAQRLKSLGANVLEAKKDRSVWAILLAQLASLIEALQLAATIIAFFLGEHIEAVTILIVILLNTGIGFYTEYKAQRALSALEKQNVRHAHIVRDGLEREVSASELVPGDLVILSAGARVPADGRIVHSVQLQIEESALTGESQVIDKVVDAIQDRNTALPDRINMAFLGTNVTSGRGRMLVTATGAESEVGKIGRLIDEALNRQSPLEQKLSHLGRLLIVVVLVLAAVIVVSGTLLGRANFWHMLEIGLSLAIAAVPEGLPAVTTMTLALGMQRMARMQSLVRSLPAVETLGSVTVICTDKTGTLTKNEMTVSAISVDRRQITVSGSGYEPKGAFLEGTQSVDAKNDQQLAQVLRIATLCNDAKVQRSQSNFEMLGDPTEVGLIVVGEKAGIDAGKLNVEFPRVSEIPFESASKRMVTVHATLQGQDVAFLKGSPGVLLDGSKYCLRREGIEPLTAEDRKEWQEISESLAGSALRVLAVAYRELPDNHTHDDLTQELIFAGLIGLQDPLRDEAKAALANCRSAGIRTVMITGDQQTTAAAIARRLQIDVDLQGNPLQTVHGRDLDKLDHARWNEVVASTAVYARVSPEQKLRIVEALQSQGQVVAMTGDGVNDAPALKIADIGIAMGIKGTEVAKENADMVITDDNFASIVRAIEQGRSIYENIIRFLHYLLSCNCSEILAIFFAMLCGWPLPLMALQLLWINLVTDVLPAFALALEPTSTDSMRRPPRDPHEPIVSARFVGLVVWQGMLLAGVTLAAFWIGLQWHGDNDKGLPRATTMAFMTLALSQVLHAFSARSQRQSIFSAQLFTNWWLWGAVAICISLQFVAVNVPIMQRVLHIVQPSAKEWCVIFACSLMPILLIELLKLFRLWLRPAST